MNCRFIFIAQLLVSLVAAAAAAVVDEKIPETRNSPLIAIPERAKVSEFSGGATYSYEIRVPPGTGGATPSLALTYSSLTKNTPYGFGWNLNLSKIERCTRFGAPAYDDPAVASSADEFELDGELLARDPTSANTFYRRKHDGSRVRYFATGDYWEVTLPDGTRQLYGSRANGVELASGWPTGANSVLTWGAELSGPTFRWALDEVIDPAGNSYRIDYLPAYDTSHQHTDWIEEIYPAIIRYSFHPSAPASQNKRTVEFVWGPRGGPDDGSGQPEIEDKPLTFRSGFRIEIEKRLAAIRVGFDSGTDGIVDSLVRSYDLVYADKLSNARLDEAPFSKLVAIDRYGSDEQLPPFETDFDYTPRPDDRLDLTDPNALTELTTPTYTIPQQHNPTPLPYPDDIRKGVQGYAESPDVGTRAATRDLNGDGVIDRVLVRPSGVWEVSTGYMTSDRELRFDPVFNWQWCSSDTDPSTCSDTTSDAYEPKFVEYSTCVGCIDRSPLEVGDQFLNYQLIGLIDLDGDGRPERVESVGSSYWYYYRNLGDRWGLRTQMDAPALSGAFSSYQKKPNAHVVSPSYGDRAKLADVNGDGRPDHLASEGGDIWVSVNLGCDPTCSFAAPEKVSSTRQVLGDLGTGGLNYPDSYGVSTAADIFDVNGDGFPDLVSYFDSIYQGDDCFRVAFGIGSPGASTSQWFQAWDGSAEKYVGGHIDCSTDAVAGLHSTFDYHAINPSGPYSRFTTRTFGDFNGDGYQDVVHLNIGIPNVRYGFGGVQFPMIGITSRVASGPHAYQMYTNRLRVDVDGDGINEVILAMPDDLDAILDCGHYNLNNPRSVGWHLAGDCTDYEWGIIGTGPPEGLLTQARNEIGGTTTISYESSRVFDSIPPTDDTESLPVETTIARSARWVATGVVHSDGRMGTPTEVVDGMFSRLRYDLALRRDLGFRMTEASDATGTTVRSHFHQASERLGRRLKAETFSTSGELLSLVSTTWSTWPTENASGSQVPESWLAKPIAEFRVLYDAGGSFQAAMVDRDFDRSSGALTSELDRGPDLTWPTSDDRKTEWTYAVNDSAWLMNYAKEKREYKGASADPVGIETFYYDGSADPEIAPTEGRITQYDVTYEPNGSAIAAASATAVTNTQTWNYDAFGNPTLIYDARSGSFAGSAARTIAYDTTFNTFPVSVTNRLGHVRSFDVDPGLGEVRQLLDENGYLRCWSWDQYGRLEKLEGAANAVAGSGFPGSCDVVLADFQFVGVGTPETQHIVENLYPEGSTSTPLVSKRFFDGWGREHQYHAPGQSATDFFITTMGWDSRGLESCASLPQRGASQLAGTCSGQYPHRETTFDELARPTSVTLHTSGNASIVESTSTYTAADLDGLTGPEWIQQLTVYTGSAQAPDRVRRFGVDIRGQTVAVEESGLGGGLTLFRRDPRGRITQVDGPDITYADGVTVDANQLDVGYDFLDRRISVTPPGHYGLVPDGCGGTAPSCAGDRDRFPWFYEYDENGNLIRQFSPKGTQRDFRYDGLDRIVLDDVAPMSTDGTAGAGDHLYAYDTGLYGKGRLAAVAEGALGWTTALSYRLDGQIVQRQRVVAPSYASHESLFEYDRHGRLLSERFPDLSESSYNYDGALLRSIDLAPIEGGSAAPVVQGLTYHASGAIAKLDLPTGFGLTTTTYVYDSSTYRLDTATTNAATDGVIQSVDYDFDWAGNLLRANDGQGLDQIFDYDPHHRLIHAASTDLWGHAYGTIAYAYDPAGNLTQMGDRVLKYGCSQGGPQAVTQVEVASVSDRQYSYDLDGSVTSVWRAGTSTLDLPRNDRGQVQTVDTIANVASYVYDEAGQRLSKSHSTPGGAIVDRTYVSANYESMSDGGSFEHTRHFFVGDRRVASITRDGRGTAADPGDPLSETHRYYHPDQVGTNTLVTDGTGALVQETIHTPFGRQHAMLDGAGAALSHSGSTTRHLFTDQEYDPESELSYFGARFHDPEVGRFLSRDPLSVVDRFDEPQRSNAYSYSLNRPLTMVDPDGLDPIGAMKALKETWAAFSGASDGRDSGSGDEDESQSGGGFFDGLAFVPSPAGGPFPAIVSADRFQESLDASIVANAGAVAGSALAVGGLAAPSLATAGLIRLAPLVPSAGILANRLLSLQKPVVKNPALVRAADKLFQTTDQFAGGTAGAIRVTQFTGRLVGGSNHIQAGIDRARQLQNIMNRGGLSASDQAAAMALRSDLVSALRFGGASP